MVLDCLWMTKNKIIEAKRVFDEHIVYARNLARRLIKKFPKEEVSEFEASALVGLWDAARSYHSLPEEEFKAVALSRIRGAILDEIRLKDWLPRKVRKDLGSDIIEVRLEALTDGLVPIIELEMSYVIDMEEEIDKRRKLNKLSLAIDSLPTRSRNIVKAILAGDKQEDIGLSVGVTHGRVNQIAKEAAKTLNQEIAA